MISIRLSPQVEKELRDIAEFEGVSVSDYIRNLIYEKMEDDYDIKIADISYKEYLENPKTYSLDEIKKDLGL